MLVIVLLAAIWAAVMSPRLLRSHAARREAFIRSFGRPDDDPAPPPPSSPAPVRSPSVARRRRILGSLLAAMATTAVAGLVPALRPLLYVHLLLDDAFLAYVALLAHQANRRSAAALPAPATAAEQRVAEDVAPAPATGRRGMLPRPVVLDLPPFASAG